MDRQETTMTTSIKTSTIVLATATLITASLLAGTASAVRNHVGLANQTGIGGNRANQGGAAIPAWDPAALLLSRRSDPYLR
jgi:hypothetical protein